jgi:hypothetical protein
MKSLVIQGVQGLWILQSRLCFTIHPLLYAVLATHLTGNNKITVVWICRCHLIAPNRQDSTNRSTPAHRGHSEVLSPLAAVLGDDNLVIEQVHQDDCKDSDY